MITTITSVLGVLAFPIALILLIYFLVLRPAQLSSGTYVGQQRIRPGVTGHSSVSPFLIVEDPAEFLEFANRVFGALGTHQSLRPDGTIMRLEVRIGDSIVIASAPTNWSDAQKSTLHVWADNTDERYNRALQAGAVSLLPPRDQEDGRRLAAFVDPIGITWWIETR